MIRAAGYCRVSTERDDQANSFASQKSYFRDYIRRVGWELIEIYADEGITGTSTKNRTQFSRMMEDARRGRFDRIVTKEVSRFSRNILDTIACTRALKKVGVTVLFLNDGIDTADADSELRLSIMASIAQEESRKTSSRVTWGQTRRMEKGVVFGRSLLGYDLQNGTLKINSDGAELVRLIFHKYVMELKGVSSIADFLNDNGKTTITGSKWTPASVLRVLKNEKYMGDLVQKKTFTPDYLTHEKKKNTGQVPMVILRNHHEPIIAREIWKAAQSRLCQNNKHTPDVGHSQRYGFSGKIRCGECASVFVSRVRYQKDGNRKRRWCCSTALRSGVNGCSVGKLINDDDAKEMVKAAIRSLKLDLNQLAAELTEDIMAAHRAEQRVQRTQIGKIRTEVEQTKKKREKVMDCYFSGEIAKDDMDTMCARYDKNLEMLGDKLAKCERENIHPPHENTEEEIMRQLMEITTGEGNSEISYQILVHSITVFRDRHMELKLEQLEHIFHFRETRE